MPISKLSASLLSDARKEAEEVVKAADSQVERQISEEKAKRVLLLKSAEDECEKRLAEQERERTAWARLEAKRIVSEAKEDAIKTVIEDIYESLPEVKKSKDYAEFMKRSLALATSELGDSGTVLHVVKGDKKFVGSFKGKVFEDLEAEGGLLLETSDGKVGIRLTLESILESKKDDLRKKISEKLFG
jgi:vacuolar-type H+-ATPase subunit E/Vma4